MPFVLDLIVVYIKSSSSKQDDKVLEIVQEGAAYLAQKENNDVSYVDSSNLKQRQMRVEEC
jgi:hypothetical protein